MGEKKSDDPSHLVDFKVGRRFGNWRIKNKLDEGGFGQVYRVESVKKKGEYAALKAEPNEMEGGSAIKLEIMILQFLNRDGQRPHVMQVFHCAKHRKFTYMIVTLLGENLRTLKLNCVDEKMSSTTWCRIGIQCLYSIKLLHDVGFVHRDIKPANFVMGHESDPDRCRCVHILDFGLARNFAFEIKRGVWIARRARGSAEFRGTMRYCSPSVHEKLEQGRKDDLWSLIYLLIELHCGLPWQREKDRAKLEYMKLNIKDSDLLRSFPVEMHPVLPHLRSLDCYNRPDYSMIHQCFLKLMKRLNVKFSDKYDWETEAQVTDAIRRRKTNPEHEHAEEFFASDPLKINAPPKPGIDIRPHLRTQEIMEEIMQKNEVKIESIGKTAKTAKSLKKGAKTTKK